MAAWASRSLRHSRIPATSFLGAQSKFRRWALTCSSVPHSRCSGASSNGFGSPRLWSSVRRKSSGQFSSGEQRALSTNLRYRTASGPGSPRGQPAWGGGCDRPFARADLLNWQGPVATARGSVTFVVNLYAMKPPRLLFSMLPSLLVLTFIASAIPIGAQRTTQPAQRKMSSRSPRDEALWQRALAIQRRAIVIDTHNDVTTPMTNDDYDLGGSPPTPYRTSIERMKKGGLNAEFFSLYVKPWYVAHGGAARRTLDMIDSVYRAVERHPNDLMFATTSTDIRRAKAQGKIACLMGIEGGQAIENSLPTLREFYRLGVRYMTLTWNNTNDWADARGDKTHNGLTDFGKEVVREMNRLGMLVDISHVSDKTMSDALDVSKAPVIASHSSSRAVSNVLRNIPDDLLKRIAKNGGVVQVNFYSLFVDQKTVTPQADERGKLLKDQQEALSVKYANDPERLAEESDKLEAAN